MAFPTAIPTYAGFTSSHTLSADNHAAQSNAEQGDIIAIASKVGTGSSTPTSGMLLRATGAGVSSWAQVNLTTDVTGVLPQANGGTGTTLATGTGKAVYDTAPTISNPTFTGGGSWAGSPTLTTPTVASFINANHDHTNSAGGGQLGFGALLSTIFSGQVVTGSNAGSAGGTTNLVNLGGLKISWGITALCTALANNGNVTLNVTLPTTYTNPPIVVVVASDYVVDARVAAGLNSSPTTTNIPIEWQSLNGTINTQAKAHWIAIGT